MESQKTDINNIWNYYLSLEADLAQTSRYIEPKGQENVFSFEFGKILILAATEAESLFKLICKTIESECNPSNMPGYHRIILDKYPKIVEATVYVSRLGTEIKPFESWDTKNLNWWASYQSVKHNRSESFEQASYMNAVTALSALYILICYYSVIIHAEINADTMYIQSDYAAQHLLAAAPQKLPDFA